VGGRLYIDENASLTSLSGLERLAVVVDDLRIYNNPSLVSLSGLNNLKAVRDDLEIYSNPSLESLSDLSALTTVTGDLTVEDHDNLCEDEVDELLAQLISFTGTVTNTDNLGTCPSA
jgi:hypothetical protein